MKDFKPYMEQLGKSKQSHLITLTGYQGSGVEFYYNSLKTKFKLKLEEKQLDYDIRNYRSALNDITSQLDFYKKEHRTNFCLISLVNFSVGYFQSSEKSAVFREVLSQFQQVIKRFLTEKPAGLNIMFYWSETSKRELLFFLKTFGINENDTLHIK
jgi:hypothetical protein